jgi:hypothetical protein
MHFKARLLHYQAGTVARFASELALQIVGLYHSHAHLLATCHALVCETDFIPPENEVGTWEFFARVVSTSGGSSARSHTVIVAWVPNPDQLTLTVNGTSYSFTRKALEAGKSDEDPVHLKLKSKTGLHVTAQIHGDLPHGWSIVVFHPGDGRPPQGNNAWYEVCRETLNPVCEGDSYGVDAANGGQDFVLAQLLRPDRLELSVKIYIDWTK